MRAVLLDRVTKVYKGGVLAVNDVSLSAEQGELLVLVGPSGSGKTTILRIIAGLEELTSGEVWLGGQPVNELRPQERNVAMVFQDGALYPHRSVRDNLAFPLRVARMDEPTIDARVSEIAHSLGIEKTLDRRPSRLSGGERQRVAVGRALIRREPQVLLMDEPLASLDVGLRSGLRAEIASLVRLLNLTTVYVTRDHAEAMSLADRVAVLRDGVVQDVGEPTRVYSAPATAFVAAFMSSPPISLVWATIWVVNGDRIVIDFGSQHINLRWTDRRSESLTPYHGESVIVGIRPEALTPSSNKAADWQIRGKVNSLDYQGREWHARLEVGFRPVDLDTVGRGPRRLDPRNPVDLDTVGRGPRRFGPRHHSTAESSTGNVAQLAPKRRGMHRSAHLLVRLDSPDAWARGEKVWITVDVPQIQVFDSEGMLISASSSPFSK